MIVLKLFLSLVKVLNIGTGNSERGEIMGYTCPICGYKKLSENPYDNDGNPSHEICKCCGFEFGYDEYIEDDNGEFLELLDAQKLYRANWIKEGANLHTPSDFPKEVKDGNKLTIDYLEKQLMAIGIDFKELT